MRQALARENICTADELKEMNVWTFMNRNNLYSISERQNVLSKVRELLAPPQPVNEKNLYKLYCGEAVYCGETPSQAFVRFCEYAAGEYPLFFRSLFDRKFAGAPVAYICRSGEGDEFIKMENPTCFVDAELTNDEAAAAAEWICRQCGEEKKVYIKEPEKEPETEEVKIEEEKTEAPPETSETSGSAFLAYTIPSWAFYNGEALGCSTWSDLYARLMRKFYRKCEDKFYNGMSFFENGKKDFGTKTGMIRPEAIADGLFLECCCTAVEIVDKIHWLTDYCSIDAAGIIVEYRRRDGSAARQSVQALWNECKEKAPSNMRETREDKDDKIIASNAAQKESAEKSDEISDKIAVREEGSGNPLARDVEKTVYLKEPEKEPEEIKNEEEKNEAPPAASETPKILNGAFLAYTRPSRAFYNGESMGCSTWSDLYTRLVRKFYRAHGEKFYPGMSFYNDGKADFGSSSDMFSPEEIADGLFLECFYPPAEIVGKIHCLADYCSIDASSIVVEYKKRDGSTARQSLQMLWEKCTAGAPPSEPEIKTNNVNNKSSEPHVEKIKVKEKRDNPLARDVEKFVRDADLDGISFSDLCGKLPPRTTAAAVRTSVEQNKRIAEIQGKLYHEDAFVDWQDGANSLCTIMEKLMRKNDGYVSSLQLYDYARSEMNMFLNDNDMNDEKSVFDMARHLFEKNSFGGMSYSFAGKTHISKKEDAIGSIFDIICKFAEEKGGVFEENELASYLEKIGVKNDSLHVRMKINLDAAFFLCGDEKVIYAKSMNLDNERKENIKSALEALFNDVGDHIILREIHPLWFERLPRLPENTPWNALLLQSVLLFFGKELGARTIAAMEKQNVDTLHAMLVKNDSPIQTFADAVAAYLVENNIDKRHLEAEELRRLLLDAKMIRGNELFGNMPKALAKDERFAWDAKGENVTIRV